MVHYLSVVTMSQKTLFIEVIFLEMIKYTQNQNESVHDSFGAFDMLHLMSLAELYPDDFDSMERMALEHELIIYIDNLKEDERFAHLNGIGDLVKVMVQTREHLSYPLVYQLLKLALVLPVATTTMERCFSTMKLVKSDLRNRIW